MEIEAKEEAQAEEKQMFAEVLYISDYSGRNRTHVCTLQPNRKKLDEEDRMTRSIVYENEGFIKAVPVDKRYPWIHIDIRSNAIRAKLGLGKGTFPQKDGSGAVATS